MSPLPRRWAAALIGLGLGVLCLAAWPRPAAAHGGVVWLDDNYGAFHLVVQTVATLSERQLRFTIVVNQRDYGQPISDARVTLRAVLSGTNASAIAPVEITVPAEPSQDGFYDTPVILPQDGIWQVHVGVQRQANSASAAFVLPVQPPPDAGSPIWWLALLPVALAAGVFFYYWSRPGSRKPPPASP